MRFRLNEIVHLNIENDSHGQKKAPARMALGL
jgi:hypothetical protein